MRAHLSARRVGKLLAAAALVISGISLSAAGDKLVLLTPSAGLAAAVVVDSAASSGQAAAPLELLLFVHRPDRPLRPLAERHEGRS